MVRAKTKQLRVVKEPSTELAGLVDDWLAEQRARGLSPRSVGMARATVVNHFLPWAAARGVTTAEELDAALLGALSRYLLEEHRTPKGELLSRESVRTYLRTMRGFVNWSSARGDLKPVKVPMPKAPTRVIDVLTYGEMKAMEDAAVSERDKLIIRLLGDLGLRLGELLALRPADLLRRDNRRFLHVTGKGKRERVVPTDPRLFDRLERYSRRPQMHEALSGVIFTTDRRHAGYYSPLSQRAVQQLLHFTAERAGITKRVYAHLFRHSHATHALNAGVPIKHVQENLGHADLGMLTNVYSHISPGDRYESMLALIRRDEDERRR